MTNTFSQRLLGGASKAVLFAAAIGAAGFWAPQAARADVITIGLSVNGGAPTSVGSSPTGDLNYTNTAYNGYSVSVTGKGNPPLPLPSLLDSNTLDISSSGSANVLDVYVTESGITTATGAENFISDFTSNVLLGGWSVTESAYVDPGDGIFTEVDAIGSATFTGVSTSSGGGPVNVGSGPYSATVEYQITSGVGKSGSTNDTIDLLVPEPMSLTLFGAGLVGLGVLRRRRKPSA